MKKLVISLLVGIVVVSSAFAVKEYADSVGNWTKPSPSGIL